MRNLLLCTLLIVVFFAENAFAQASLNEIKAVFRGAKSVIYHALKGKLYGIEIPYGKESMIVEFDANKSWYKSREVKAEYPLRLGTLWGSGGTQAYDPAQQYGYFFNPESEKKIVRVDYNKLDHVDGPFTEYEFSSHLFTGPRFVGPNGDIYITGKEGGDDKLYRVKVPENIGKVTVSAVATLPFKIQTGLSALDPKTNKAYILAGTTDGSTIFRTTIACNLGSGTPTCSATGDEFPYNANTEMFHTDAFSWKNKIGWIRRKDPIGEIWFLDLTKTPGDDRYYKAGSTNPNLAYAAFTNAENMVLGFYGFGQVFMLEEK